MHMLICCMHALILPHVILLSPALPKLGDLLQANFHCCFFDSHSVILNVVLIILMLPHTAVTGSHCCYSHCSFDYFDDNQLTRRGRLDMLEVKRWVMHRGVKEGTSQSVTGVKVPYAL